MAQSGEATCEIGTSLSTDIRFARSAVLTNPSATIRLGLKEKLVAGAKRVKRSIGKAKEKKRLDFDLDAIL